MADRPVGVVAEPAPLTRLLATKPPRDWREAGRAFGLALLGHAALLLLVLYAGRVGAAPAVGDEGVGTGIGAGPAGGGGGGSSGGEEVVTFFRLVEPAPPETPAPLPVPPPPVEAVPVPPEPVALPEPAALDVALAPVFPAAGSGTGQGAGSGPGVGPGVGPGSGGGTGGGHGGGIGSGVGPGTGRGRLLGPAPEVLLIPPAAPGAVRGKTVVVRLTVDATGLVREAEVVPSTGDRGYDRLLRETALGWRFRPARDASNRPVPATFEVTFTF